MLLLDLAMSSPAYWTIAKPNRGNVRVSYYSGGQPGFGYHVGVNVVVVGSFAKRILGVASKKYHHVPLPLPLPAPRPLPIPLPTLPGVVLPLLAVPLTPP